MDPGLHRKFHESVSCQHAAACPGCPRIAQSYSDQLKYKRRAVQSAMAGYAELTAVSVAPVEGADQVRGYRTRAKLVVLGSSVGLFARGTHDVVDTPDCQVLDPLVKDLVHALRGELSAGVALDGVDVARVGERLIVTLIAKPTTEERDLQTLARSLEARVPQLAGVAFTRRLPDAVQLLSGGHSLLLGVGELRSPTRPYHYAALGAFQQAHEGTAATIYQRLKQRLFAGAPSARRLRVLELYAGSGALSLSLAAHGADVVAVESYGPACERMQRAAREQSLSVAVQEGDAARELRALWEAGERFDAVLVNPPRRGLEPEVREIVTQLSARAVGYVSCKPSTLARDLAHFARLGLVCVEMVPFDMMPLTEQVETFCWLMAAAPAAPRVLYQDADLLVVDKAPHEQVDARGARGLMERARSLPGCAAAVPVTSLASGSSGALLLARDEVRAVSAREALTGPRVFTALVRGVVRERGKLRVAGRAARYQRLEVRAGHSLVRVEAEDDAHVLRAFRALGQPVIGDRAADRASAKHFLMRHGLDRTFLHEHALVLPGAREPREVLSELAPDLQAVLASMVL